MGACSFCRINIDLWNKSAKNELFQVVLERMMDDFCYVGRFSLYLSSCKRFSQHFVPGLLENLSEIILTPDYICSTMGMCERHPAYEPMNADDYIRAILSDKPDYLKNDDFIDKLYEQIEDDGDKNQRKTISLI